MAANYPSIHFDYGWPVYDDAMFCDTIHLKQDTASRLVLMENAAMLKAFCSGYACKSVRLPLDLPPAIRLKDAKAH